MVFKNSSTPFETELDRDSRITHNRSLLGALDYGKIFYVPLPGRRLHTLEPRCCITNTPTR